MRVMMLVGVVAGVLGGCGGGAREVERVGAVIDGYHAAAARADLEAYIGAMGAEGVFLGTDATERWTRAEFEAFCRPYFEAGRGWDYRPIERHVRVDGRVAWFDEILKNEKYGTLRSTGVLRRSGGAWRIEHYSLTFLVPNEVAGKVVEEIERHEAGGMRN